MKINISYLLLLTAVILLFSSCLTKKSEVKIKKIESGAGYRLTGADSPLIFYHGRIDRRNPEEPIFDWAASGFSVRFTGTSIGMILSDSGNNDFSVFIDGKLNHRMAAEAGEHRILLAGNLQPGEHQLDFFKSTESDQGITTIKGLLLEPGSDLLPLEKPDFRIQVFGDSVSSGYGTAAPHLDTGWHREHADACQTWPFFTARAFDAELTLTAASGRGILRNYGEPGPQSKVSFSSLAWRVLIDDSTFPVPETEPVPDLVIICLGHNDMSPGYTLSRDEFRRGYLDFLGGVRRHWPGVTILCGSVRQEPLSGWLREILDEKTTAGDKALYWYAFSRPGLGEFGCDYHPNARAQKRFAREILPLITRVTGWEPVH
jgi:lysophospholipase L1-like esterase